MDFSLTREQEMLKKLAAEFAEKELEPAARAEGRTAVPAAVAASAGKGGPVCPV